MPTNSLAAGGVFVAASVLFASSAELRLRTKSTGLVSIGVRTDEVRVLGHKDAPDHPRPTFSPDSRKILIESGLLHDFTNLNLMTIAIPFGLGR